MKQGLLRNRWRTPDGTVLESKHHHDFVSHVDENGEFYFVDGGTWYVRVSSNVEPMVDECVYLSDDFEIVRESVFRNSLLEDYTYEKIFVKDMTEKHLCNTVLYNLKIMGYKEKPNRYCAQTHLYIKELCYRNNNGFYIGEYNYKSDVVPEPSKLVLEECVCKGGCSCEENSLEKSVYVLEKYGKSEIVYNNEFAKAIHYLNSVFDEMTTDVGEHI